MIFALGTLASALSSDVVFLIAGQGLLGLGIALSAPACLALIKQEVSIDKHGESIGLWAGLSGAFGVLGLLVGGIVIEQFEWQMIFYSTLPLTILAFLIVPKEQSNIYTEKKEINLRVAIGIFIGVFLIVYSLIQGNQNLWESWFNYVSLIGSLVFFLWVIVWQNKMENPLIPTKIFKTPEVLGANLGTFFIYFSLNGIYIFLIFHLQDFYNYSPIHAGWAMIPASLMVTLFASFFGKLQQRKGGRNTLRIGTILTAVAFIGLLFLDEKADYFTHIFPSILILGIGMALFVSPITSAALNVAPDESGLASGVNNLVARFSGILAVGILGGIFSMMEPGVIRFQICVGIMATSALLGAFFIWILIPSNKGRTLHK